MTEDKKETKKTELLAFEKSVYLKEGEHNAAVKALLLALENDEIDEKQWLIEVALKEMKPTAEQVWNRSWKKGKMPKVK